MNKFLGWLYTVLVIAYLKTLVKNIRNNGAGEPVFVRLGLSREVDKFQAVIDLLEAVMDDL